MKTPENSTCSDSLPLHAIEAGMADRPFGSGSPRVICPPSQMPAAHLTPRQLDVLALLCEGMTNKHISRKLGISSATVKIHISCILRALDVDSRLQAVIAARRLGLMGGEPAYGKMAQPGGANAPRGPVTLRIVWDEMTSQWLAATADEPMPEAAA